MNNKEYIAELSRHTGFSQDDTQRMVRCVVEGMSQKFDEGIGVSIASFGVFEIKKRMERIVVNPSSGQRMLVPPKIVVTFKAETSARKTANVPKGFVDISDFGRVLTERYGLNDNDAFSFVHFMFATVSEELLVHPDATVKIKGLGSFKTGRGKYSFSPEVMLRDRINRPFLQFETVILNDGVDFSEMDEEDFADSEDNDEVNDEVDNVAETEADMQEPMAEEEPADAEVESEEKENGPAVVQTDNTSTEEQLAEAVLSEGQPVEADRIEEQPSESEVADVHCECDKAEAPACAQSSEEQTERERCRKMAELLMSKKTIDKEEEPQMVCRQKNPRLTYWLSALSFLLLIGIGAGLYALYVRIETRNQAIEKLEKQIKERKQALSKQTVADRHVVKPTQNPDSQAAAIDKEAIVESKAAVQNKPSVEKEPAVEVKPQVQTGITDYNYDARVRTGAYVIVGIDHVVTVQKGQTLASISKAFLGDGMECYVEVLNKCTDVKPGDRLKIPKLKLKKRMRNNS